MKNPLRNLRIVAISDDMPEPMVLLEDDAAFEQLIGTVQSRLLALSPTELEVLRQKSGDCQNPSCVYHSMLVRMIDDLRCTKTSGGMRCLLRGSHAGTHMILREKRQK